jgi:hypothetical protein
VKLTGEIIFSERRVFDRRRQAVFLRHGRYSCGAKDAGKTGFATFWNYVTLTGVTANTSIAIFNRAIELDDEPLSPDTARHILRWGFAKMDQTRVSELIERLKAETISQDEREELEEFNRVNHLLALLKSKARIALRASQEQ